MFVRVRFPFRVQILPTMKFLNCIKSWFKRTPKTFGCFDFDPSKIYSINRIRGVKILYRTQEGDWDTGQPDIWMVQLLNGSRHLLAFADTQQIGLLDDEHTNADLTISNFVHPMEFYVDRPGIIFHEQTYDIKLIWQESNLRIYKELERRLVEGWYKIVREK